MCPGWSEGWLPLSRAKLHQMYISALFMLRCRCKTSLSGGLKWLSGDWAVHHRPATMNQRTCMYCPVHCSLLTCTMVGRLVPWWMAGFHTGGWGPWNIHPPDSFFPPPPNQDVAYNYCYSLRCHAYEVMFLKYVVELSCAPYAFIISAFDKLLPSLPKNPVWNSGWWNYRL